MSATEVEMSREERWKMMMDNAIRQGPALPITLDMAIDSPVWHLSTGRDGRPKLTFTITSHFNHPITILTRGTVFSRRGIYYGTFHNQCLTIRDIDTRQQMYFSGSQPRPARIPARCLGTSDEGGFMTLYPGEPRTISHCVPCRSYLERFERGGNGNLTFSSNSPLDKGEVFASYFVPGHRYHIRIGNKFKEQETGEHVPDREDFQVGLWWRYSTKEEVMEPWPGGSTVGWSERMIQIGGIPGVDLRIED